MSKTRVSKVRNEIQSELGMDISYEQIAKMCKQLNIAFKAHSEMGIHYNSVIAETDGNRLIAAFREKTAPQKAAPAKASPKTEAVPTQTNPPQAATPAPRQAQSEQRPNQRPEQRPEQRSDHRPERRPQGASPQASYGRPYDPSQPRPPRPQGASPTPTASYGRPYDPSQPRPPRPQGASPGGARSEYRPQGASPSSTTDRPQRSYDGGGQRGGAARPATRKPEQYPSPAGQGGPASGRPGSMGTGGPSAGRGGPNRGGGHTANRSSFGPSAGRKGKRSKYKQEQRRINQQQRENQVPLPPEERIIELHHSITVGELAEKMQIPAAEVIKALFMKGMMTSANHMLELETAEMVAQELEYEVLMPSASEQKAASEAPKKIVAAAPVLINEDPTKLKHRPPVVTIMGHVDHGKTSLLDYIRKSKVTAGEAGGITQHIGAYMVDINGKPIAFLDTPGHEAFTAMRARGAQVTDIAILVIAADDGIMPQTIEAINHAKAAKVQIIVAVNKIDKPGADLERAKQQLTEYELVPEEWGGDTVIVPVSAMTGAGVDDLLDMILLVSEMMELKANPDRRAVGVVIESKLDKGRGAVGTVLIKNGTLKQGDSFVVGPVHGKVRAMVNERGKQLKKAGPSFPVEIIGFQDVPTAGDILEVLKTDKESKAQAAANREKLEDENRGNSRLNLSNLYENMKDGKVKELNVVVKADVQGSVDAIKQSLERLSSDKVQLRILHGATGDISQYDIMLATASDALVVGFNVKSDTNAERVAQQEHVEVRYYSIIYKLIEDIENAMEGLLEPEMVEVAIGAAEVRAVFKISKLGTIAGCYMVEGRAERNARVRVVRGGEVIHTGRISSLKRFKEDVKEVGTNYECGIGVKDFNALQEADRLEFFLIQARHEIAKV